MLSLLTLGFIQANDDVKNNHGANCRWFTAGLYGLAFNKSLKTTHEILNKEANAQRWSELYKGVLRDKDMFNATEYAKHQKTSAYNIVKDELRKLDASLGSASEPASFKKSFIRNISSSYYAMSKSKKFLCATAFGVWMARLLHCKNS